MTTDRGVQLAQHFPTLQDIPAEHRLAAPVHQRRSLIGGRMLEWNGDCKTVLSPVCTRDPATGALRSEADGVGGDAGVGEIAVTRISLP